MGKLFRVFRSSPAYYGIDWMKAFSRPYQRTAGGVLVKCEPDPYEDDWWFTFKDETDYLVAEGY